MTAALDALSVGARSTGDDREARMYAELELAGRAAAEDVFATLHSLSAVTEAILAESYSDFDTAKRKYAELLKVAPRDDVYFERATRKLGRYLGSVGATEGEKQP